MAKVLGSILTIWGGLWSLFLLFQYLNSSAHLPYNPSDKDLGLLDVGLSLPVVLAGTLLIGGIVLLATSTEPESK